LRRHHPAIFVQEQSESGSKAVKDYSRIARRITVTLFATQSLVKAAFIVSGTVSAIVGAQLSGNPACPLC